jgi:hypothetical protein
VEQPAARSADVIPGFSPESDLERRLAEDPVMLEGLAWGRPRKGHPEGSVGAHVADLLGAIDEWGEAGERRRDLRLLALVHDSLKNRVRDWLPKGGENHHAMRARRFAEPYLGDERLLAALELHDRPYAIWRRSARGSRREQRQVDELVGRIPDPALFLRFVELDGSTEGKDRRPIEWLREELRRRGAV